MARKAYEIEIVNWVWQEAMTRNNSFYFCDHKHPRIRRFATQKAAREWLASNGFEPFFKDAKRPTMFHSKRDRYGQSGLQATIREADNDAWIKSSSEAQMRDRLLKAMY